VTASATLVEPAFFTHPDYVRTLGPEVGELAALAGLPPDPEQQLLLDAAFALDRHGRSAAFEVCIICARQNMKTGFFKQMALGKAFIMDRKLLVWSAHEFSTTQEAFRDLVVMIESTPALERRVKQIHRGNGEEEIELLTGARIKFKARTKTGGRGLSGEDVVLDEGFALQAAHMGALLPTLSAQPDPQVFYGSSAGLATSEVLRGVRDRGRVGDPRLVYMEFCAPEDRCAAEGCGHELTAAGCMLDNPEFWRMANPAMDRRITVEYIAAERRALATLPEEFARERLGWWDKPLGDDGGPVVDLEQWARLASPSSAPENPVTIAVDVPPDRSSTSIAVSWLDGERVMSAVATLPGTRKAVETIRKRLDDHRVLDVSLQAGGPAGSLLADLEAEGIEVTAISTQEMARATGAFLDAVDNGTYGHVAQAELNKALDAARVRNVGDAVMWDRRDALADISPLVAVTLSAHGFTKHAPVSYDLMESFW